MTSRRTLLAFSFSSAALAWWRGAAAQAAATSPQARLQSAEARLGKVQALHTQWERLRDTARDGVQAAAGARDAWARLASSRDEALASSARANTALTAVQAGIDACALALQTAQAALPPWHDAVATLARAGPSTLPAATQAAEEALARRREADARLRAACADTRKLDNRWDNQRRGTLRDLQSAQLSLASFKRTARFMMQLGDEARASLAAAAAAHQQLLAEGQITVPALPNASLTLPAATSATALKPLVGDGDPNPQPERMDPGQFAALTTQREQLAAQWAQVRDARAYHRLAAVRVKSSTAEVARLDGRAPQIDGDLQATDRRLGDTLATARAWCAAGPAASAEQLRNTVARLDTPFATCLQDESRDFAQVEQTTARLLPQLQAAEAAARREWQDAYRAVHGSPPPETPPTDIAQMMPPPPPSAAPTMARPPDIAGHAYREFDTLDHEDDDYAAYTYVLLRSENDLKQPATLKRWLHLLKVVRERTTSADKITTQAQRERLHLFCLPLRKGASNSAYHGDLGDQLKINAQTGLLMNDAIARRLTDSPGPFLLTLPQRIATSNSRTPLLFADLAPYDENAVADLAINYMDGLLEDFPRDQTLWKPPVVQRVALAIFQCAVSTGSLIQALLPGSSTPPQVKT